MARTAAEVMWVDALAVVARVDRLHREFFHLASLGWDPPVDLLETAGELILERSDIHVHVPAGAIPKDGPSAGVAILVSLASLMLGHAVDPAVAMTGEISLRGLVLPVGGIREKVVAARGLGSPP